MDPYFCFSAMSFNFILGSYHFQNVQWFIMAMSLNMVLIMYAMTRILARYLIKIFILYINVYIIK